MRYWLLTIAVVLSISVVGQGKSDLLKNSFVKASYHYGFLLPEYSFIRQQSNSSIQGFEISLLNQSDGSKYWHRLYNFPEAGVGFFHSGLGNSVLFGHQSALFFQTGSSIYRSRNEKLAFPWQLGVGLCRVSEKYDAQTNPFNVAVGSHINIYFRAAVSWNLHLGEKFILTQGLTFHHLSNANMSEPNIGLNWLTLHHSISFGPKGVGSRVVSEVPSKDQRIAHQVYANYGIKHTRSFESYKYSTASLSYSALWVPSYIVSFGIGADFFYDSSVKDELETSQREFKNQYYFHSGIHIEQKMVYNKMSFGIQEGVYIGLKEKVGNHVLYNRAFLQRELTKSLSIMLSVKTHLHILDHVELGLGWKFKSKKQKG